MTQVQKPHLREDFAAVEEGIRATGHSDHGSHVRYEARAALRRIKEQLDTVRELNRRAEERCADAFMEARGLKEQLEAARETIEVLQDENALADLVASTQEQLETLERMRGAILFNATSFHKGEEGKDRALSVIAAWADSPDMIPEGIGQGSNPASSLHPDEADGLEPSETVASPASRQEET